MRTSGLSSAAAILLVGVCTMAASAEPGSGKAHGAVVDESGGLLPGVSVTAVSDDGRELATAVTDRVGHYVFDSLPEGPVHLTFQLEGFSAGTGDVIIGPDHDAAVAPHKLLLAAKNPDLNRTLHSIDSVPTVTRGMDSPTHRTLGQVWLRISHNQWILVVWIQAPPFINAIRTALRSSDTT